MTKNDGLSSRGVLPDRGDYTEPWLCPGTLGESPLSDNERRVFPVARVYSKIRTD